MSYSTAASQAWLVTIGNKVLVGGQKDSLENIPHSSWPRKLEETPSKYLKQNVRI